MKYLKLFEKSVKEHPFISAAKRGNTNAVKQAIKENVEINMKDSDGRTTLMHAIKFPFVVDALIEGNADVNATDKHKMTALMMASTLLVINKLLNAKADVNIRDINDNSALVYYVQYIYDSGTFIIILNKFLSHGFNLDKKNNYDENFYDYIMKYKKINDHKNEFIDNIEKYITDRFPQYKEEWEMKRDANIFNL